MNITRDSLLSKRHARTDSAVADHIQTVLTEPIGRFTELVAELRGLQLNRVLYVETHRFKTSGQSERSNKVPAAMLWVANLGTCTLLVLNGSATGNPGVGGDGRVSVPPGAWLLLPAAGNVHAFYGRAGEDFMRMALANPCPPAAGSLGDMPYFTVDPSGNGGVWGSGAFYSAPWNQPAVYGGFVARELAGAAATLEFRDRDANGVILDEVEFAPNASMEIELDKGRVAPSGTLFASVVGSVGNGSVSVR